jgi:hypothetical protein
LSSFFPETIGTCGALVLALFGIFTALRKDNTRRFDRYTDRLEHRISSLESRLDIEQHRRYLLEAILRASGIDVPPWAEDPETVSADEYARLMRAETPPVPHWIPTQRKRP